MVEKYNEFIDLAEKAVEKAEAIDVPIQEFYNGLELMRDVIQSRINVKNEES